MSEKPKRKKRIIVIVGLLLVALLLTFTLLSPEQRNGILNGFGGEGTENADGEELKDFISIQSVTSRKANIGDDWIIKGKIFNEHDSLDVSEIKLMFNFSDGVETVTLFEKVRSKNTVGRKFKERIGGHGSAQFESVEVLEAK